MATRQQFVDEMNKVYENHGVYVGTGNGELTLSVAGKFFEMEKNYGRRDKDGNPLWYTDTARDYEYLGKCYRKQWDMSESRAGDCSGQPVGALRRLNVIPETADYNCRSFMEVCETVGLTDLQPSDLVFNKAKEPSHMGVCTAIENGKPIIVESKGRDEGVVRRSVKEGSWVVGGRLPDSWFDSEDVKVLTRVLKYIPDNLMKGDDVKAVQEELNKRNFNCGTADGAYGQKTEKAVKNFQSANKLTVDGKVGKNTALALGFAWEG